MIRAKRLSDESGLTRWLESASNHEITVSEEDIFHFLETVMSARNKETLMHTKRTSKYAEILIRNMLETERFKAELCSLNYKSVVRVMSVHDLGKLGISDDILFKPGKLTDEEFDEIKTHIEMGLKIFNSLFERINQRSDVLQNYRDVIQYHHERWDGTGYLAGLSGEDIPLSARIAAVVDVYDALTSERSYKAAYSHEEAVKIIQDGAGSHFDPDIVDCFMEVKQHFKLILANQLQE